MIYTIEKANLIAEQLRKFTTGYTYQVAGQFSNIDFWINEVIEALKAIDKHKNRFDKIFETQKRWIEDHGTVVHDYCPVCEGKCEFSNGKPTLPKLKYDADKVEVRRKLIDSAYFFLTRCYRIGLLTRNELEKKCDLIGTSVDPNDIRQN